MLIDFCLPIKNEELILESNLNRILKYLEDKSTYYNWRIVILNNGSNKECLRITKTLVKGDNRIIANNIEESGKGIALKNYFLKSDADIVAFMDIDLATALENIPDLVNPIINNNFEIVIGSRLLKESKTDRSLFRELSSRLYNKYSKVLLNHHFSDLQCGFKAFNQKSAKDIFSNIEDRTWFFDTEAILLAKNKGYKIKEIPVNWKSERYFQRKSKAPLSNGWYFFKKVIEFKKKLGQEKRRLSF